MTSRVMRAVLVTAGIAAAVTLTYAASRERRWIQYEREMQDPVDDPPDAWEEKEFAFGRLRFRSPRDGRGWYARWGIDANKSDRQFIEGVRRLTRVQARSVEQIVDIDSDEIYDWPWMFAVSPGDWELSTSQAARLRAFFDRGGFLMVDDFHGESEWRSFMTGIRQIFDDPQVVELDNDAVIFHVLYSLDDRVQIPGANVVHGPGYERDGVQPHWRGIVDERGRVVIAICFNMDVGDAWEFADDPNYPEKFSSQAYRLGINYVLYAMTH